MSKLNPKWLVEQMLYCNACKSLEVHDQDHGIYYKCHECKEERKLPDMNNTLWEGEIEKELRIARRIAYKNGEWYHGTKLRISKKKKDSGRGRGRPKGSWNE